MKKIIWLCWLLAQPVWAKIEVYEFKNPLLEQRYQTLTGQLRCLVCQNQNIADSHAELAQDLRSKVYELLNQGNSDQQIVQYMTDRYGDFVLYRPPFKLKTLLLWLGPALAVLLGGIAFWRLVRRGKQPSELLAEDELKRIRNLLDSE
jgi:cytochrome c-type biogenesis protein CcmH